MTEIASRMAKRLFLAARAVDLDPAALLRASSIEAATLEDPHGRVSLERSLDVVDALLTRITPGALGIMLATTAEPDVYQTPGLVMLASESLREGFVRAFALQRLWGDGDRFAFVVDDGADGVAFRVPGTRRSAHEPIEVCALAESLLAVRGLTGRVDERPLVVRLPTLTGDTAAFSAFFGAAPQTSASRAFIGFSAEALDAPIPTANALYRSIFEQQASADIRALPAEDDTRGRVRAFIGQGLLMGRFSLAVCAGKLAMSTRTLERRLADTGTTYAAEVDSVRRERALRFLREGRPIDEVAALLGYSERASFHRACTRWFGRTPAQIRAGTPSSS